MKEHLSWIISGALCLVGIGAYLASGSGSDVDELKSKTKSLNTAIANGIHSTESILAIREPRDARQTELSTAAAAFETAKYADATAAYRALLSKRTNNTVNEGLDFSNAQWPTLKSSYDESLLNIRAKTKRPAYWNTLGHLWVEDPSTPNGDQGKFLYEADGASLHPYPISASPIADFSNDISTGTGPFVAPPGKDGIHYGKLAIVCLERVVTGIDMAIEAGLADQVFFLDEIDFSNFVADSSRGYGSADPYNRHEFGIKMQVAPNKKATLLAALNKAFATSASPRLRVVEIKVTQADVPAGVSYRITPEKAAELSGKEFPETGREFDKWFVETYPKVLAEARKLELGKGKLAMKIELRVQALTLKAEVPVLDFSSESKAAK